MVNIQVTDDGKIIVGVEYGRPPSTRGGSLCIEDVADAKELVRMLPQHVVKALENRVEVKKARIAALRKELAELEGGDARQNG